MSVTPANNTNPVRPIRTSSDLYSFRRNDTYLHTFGIRNGDIMFHMIYHRFTVCILSLYGICCIFLSWTNPLFLKFEQFYIDVTYCLFGLFTWIWVVFAILSVNRIALKLIILKFDFWVKVIFGIVFVISYNSWLFVTNKDVKTLNNLNNLNMIYLYIIESGLISIDFILIITYYSLINGMQIKFKNKLYFGWIISVFCTIFSIQFMLYAGNHYENTYTQIYPNYVSISWYSISLSSIQILTLFLFKTIYLSKKYKDKSTVINTIPSIKWISEQNTSITQNNNNNNLITRQNNNSSETIEGKDEYSDIQSVQNPLHLLTNLQQNEYSDQSESLTPTPASASSSSRSITVKCNNNNYIPNGFSKSTSL